MNLAQLLIDSSRQDPDRVAIKLDDVELTYAQLDGASAHMVGLLRDHGFHAGDRVGIMLPNVPYFPVCYYGVLRAGGVVVPMNVLLKKREVAFYLRDSGAKLLFAWEGFAEDAQAGADEADAECILVKVGEFEQQVGHAEAITEIAHVDDHDTAVILYTSGTTGTPKGAELTHANLAKNARGTVKLLDTVADPVTLGGIAAVSLVRADVRDEHDDRQRRDADADPAVRSRQGAGDHRARSGQHLRGRPDDVRGDAASPGARTL